MDRGAWQTVIAKSWTLLSMHAHIHSPVRQTLLLTFSLQERKMRLGKLSELAQSHKAEIQPRSINLKLVFSAFLDTSSVLGKK